MNNMVLYIVLALIAVIIVLLIVRRIYNNAMTRKRYNMLVEDYISWYEDLCNVARQDPLNLGDFYDLEEHTDLLVYLLRSEASRAYRLGYKEVHARLNNYAYEAEEHLEQLADALGFVINQTYGCTQEDK